MRIMRADYDKPFRCPAWSGPAFKGGPDERLCDGGSLAVAYSRHSDDWKHGYKPHWMVMRCPECATAVLPFALRLLDVSWVRWKIGWALDKWRYERRQARLWNQRNR